LMQHVIASGRNSQFTIEHGSSSRFLNGCDRY
jgi:hypothetical protein